MTSCWRQSEKGQDSIRTSEVQTPNLVTHFIVDRHISNILTRNTPFCSFYNIQLVDL